MEPEMPTKPKSLFVSTTFWGAVLTLVVAATPLIGEMVTEYQYAKVIEVDRVTELVMLLATTMLTIMGRTSATQPVFTPKFLPGPNKNDLR